MKGGKNGNGKHPGGRPVKWTPEVVESLAAELVEWMKVPVNYWMKDFAHGKGFSFQRMVEFCSWNEKFSDAYKMAQEMQESKLVKLGLSGKRNPAMAIFALKNVAGWRDRFDVTDGTGGGKKMIEDPWKALAELLGELEATNELTAILAASGIDVAKNVVPSNGNGNGSAVARGKARNGSGRVGRGRSGGAKGDDRVVEGGGI